MTREEFDVSMLLLYSGNYSVETKDATGALNYEDVFIMIDSDQIYNGYILVYLSDNDSVKMPTWQHVFDKIGEYLNDKG